MVTDSNKDNLLSPRKIFLLGSTSLPIIALAIVASLWIADKRSSPEIFAPVPTPVGSLAKGTGIIVLIDFLIRLLRTAFTRRWHILMNWRCFVHTSIVIFLVWAMNTDKLFRIRFEQSFEELDSFAKRIAAEPTNYPNTIAEYVNESVFPDFEPIHATVGRYYVQATCRFTNERIVFIQTDGFFRSGYGFLYNPDRHQSSREEIESVPVRDDWYVFWYSKS